MNAGSTDTDECPNCNAEIVIYKGWTNFRETKVEILKGAKWRCQQCGKKGKLDEDLLVD